MHKPLREIIKSKLITIKILISIVEALHQYDFANASRHACTHCS